MKVSRAYKACLECLTIYYTREGGTSLGWVVPSSFQALQAFEMGNTEYIEPNFLNLS